MTAWWIVGKDDDSDDIGRRVSTVVSQWARRWKAEFSPSKCHIMGIEVGPHDLKPVVSYRNVISLFIENSDNGVSSAVIFPFISLILPLRPAQYRCYR